MIKFLLLFLLSGYFLLPVLANKENNEKKEKEKNPMAGLKFRSIGPALTSGRIADFAVNPKKTKEYYVAVASGHVWKTTNAGITFSPVFENYGAYSIGCIAMDPQNPHVLWLGTGENNHQRALGYGDGVYKTMDAGKTWENMGLKNSRQIGAIVIHPTDSNVVYVACEGSVWGPGGDRGLYKTTDGGKTWKNILKISEDTGINSVVMDPRYPELLYATANQRRRHVYTKINGGPESGFYKSTDGGNTWRKITSDLPTDNVGEYGIAVSPANPDIIYAIIEAGDDKGGFYRSLDRGESWIKRDDYYASGQYYNEIYCDPTNVDIVYAIDTFTKITVDGGKKWKTLGNKDRHVDDHALWIDPADGEHLLIGGDGGIYESYDRGTTWHFKSNLPVTQFYRVAVDNEYPFYNVYGGTQDNNTLGGPSRVAYSNGISNFHWFVPLGGDGFWVATDPTDPTIIYVESQYGNMNRFDRKSGERKIIKPQPRENEVTYKWNWDTPLIISPHQPKRLYCAANKVFRSDDRGDSWQVISADLTTQTDRNSFKAMGKFWSVDSVNKDLSTSLFGTIVSLAESPVKEDLLYAGTDDGVIAVSENGGKSWTRYETLPSVPKYTYVSDILPCQFSENTVYACFNNHKQDDFKPYVLKSTDQGKTWVSIAAGLPENGPVHTIAQDFVKADLLFVGTEFGCFFSHNGGKNWLQLKGGMPTISIKDIAIQKRECDLVLASFGRGFFILDDYSCLREYQPETLAKAAHIFPIKDALMYQERSGYYGQGATFFTAPNPEYGATFTYYIKDEYRTEQENRRKQESLLFKKGEKIPILPLKDLRREKLEEKPLLIFTITDAAGHIIRKLETKPQEGINRITWDLRYPATYPKKVEDFPREDDYWDRERKGFPIMPGKYQVSLALFQNGKKTNLVDAQSFMVNMYNNSTLPAADSQVLTAFQNQVAELIRIIYGADNETQFINKTLKHIQQTLFSIQGEAEPILTQLIALQQELDDIDLTINGFPVKASFEEIPPASYPIKSRLEDLITSLSSNYQAPGAAQKESCQILLQQIQELIKRLKQVKEEKLPALEKQIDQLKAPWTRGRLIEG
jgi:photosystem II stability/assembly factor-like uncharacterized protein